MCRQGASVIQSRVLAALDDPGLRAFVVWVPILPTDTATPDDETRALVSDARAVHFWDAHRTLPPLFSAVLRLPADWPAWDVYLAYPPGTFWDDRPPAPEFWHHQLGTLEHAPRLDGAAFLSQLRTILPTARRQR
jgi:hypothetical protein